jgi:hypothetical protein
LRTGNYRMTGTNPVMTVASFICPQDNNAKETIVRERFSGLMMTVAIVAAAAVISGAFNRTLAQAPHPAVTASPLVPVLKTPWGEPDLQGIWTDENDTPLQRPAKYANQEFFTATQRAELDEARTAVLGQDQRAARGSENDVASGYNSSFWSWKRIGARTSLIADPPNGRIPPLTPDAQKMAAAEREFRFALLQSTETCRAEAAACGGGRYNPTPSPRRAEPPPRYNTARINRNNGPEDSTLAERCLTGGLPEFGGPTGSFRRIVQTPGGISMFYDVGQGQGWQRNIVMDGNSRGHFEGGTLVIDVTNFSRKTDFQGSREDLHLVERWTRTSPTTLEYVVTIEDPTVWTRPWTVRQEFTRQSEEENRLYYEPRCIEGNFGLPGLLHGRRMEEFAFAQGRGPDPATRDNTHGSFVLEEDPLR